MFNKKKNKEIEVTGMANNANEIEDGAINQVPADSNFRYALIKAGKFASNPSPRKVLTSKTWDEVGGWWDVEIKDIVTYIQNINTVDYKFGVNEILIRYEIIPVKHESKLIHEYKIGE